MLHLTIMCSFLLRGLRSYIAVAHRGLLDRWVLKLMKFRDCSPAICLDLENRPVLFRQAPSAGS
jgi:hypothetical protein